MCDEEEETVTENMMVMDAVVVGCGTLRPWRRLCAHNNKRGFVE